MDNPDHDYVDNAEIEPCVIPLSADKRTSSISWVDSSPVKSHSLAEQYLDTTVDRDDDWRAACLWHIHEGRRQQRILQRCCEPNSSVGLSNRSNLGTKIESKMETDRCYNSTLGRLETDHYRERTLKGRLRNSDCQVLTRSLTSDSQTAQAAMRPARKSRKSRRTIFCHPRNDGGRRCLSCKSTSTSCWRQAFGGIICNSCGLR